MATQAAKYPPLPLPNPLTQFFWDGCRDRRLMILRCQNCRFFVHYPRPVCPKCLSTELAAEQVSGEGKLYGYTVTVQAFHPYYVDKVPYTLAVVELAEQQGPGIATVDLHTPEEPLRTDLPVRLTWREVAPDLVLPMFAAA